MVVDLDPDIAQVFADQFSTSDKCMNVSGNQSIYSLRLTQR